ncbi:MAG: mannose-1-phosphate guanylyltransferase [Bacteroidales bacterium]|nr:mannose-1-phosphate guanylyltransferase [Candidatus Colimorpha onthohippi]
MNDHYCVIMAGGVGSRFWPLSKNNFPKQFLDVLGTGKSFIRSTFERFLPIVPVENFLVVTNEAYKHLVLEHIPELSENQVLCEPMRRNTAPCIAYASYRIQAQCPNAVVAVTPADHLVTNEVEFQRVIGLGFDFVSHPDHQDALMTVGIRPSRPETGYGYIEVSPRSLQNAVGEVVPMDNFKEKPDLETAKQFLEAGRYFWNSGIFVWSIHAILSAFKSYLPDMAAIFDEGASVFATDGEQQFINENFARCENISIDYGVMERSQCRYTIPADFGWSDIGTYGSLYTHATHDANGNAKSGTALLVESKNCVVNIEEGTEAIVQGMDRCLVVYRNGSLLVCRMDDEQRIKQWVEQIGR